MLTLFTALSALGFSADTAAASDRPPIQIWMNNDRRFREGERVRLQVDADVDGFLLVLNYDTDGRLRVLFPVDPRDDSRVRAGRRYEVRDDGGDQAFRAGGDGTGLIYSAISSEPWRFDDVVQQDRWDYTRLLVERTSEDPETAITELVQQLAGPAGFDYDVAGYRVYGSSTSYAYTGYYARGPIYIYDDYLYCNGWSWRFDGCRRWPYDGGWSFGFGYSPYRYGYRPYGYGYNPYYPSYPYRPSGHGGRGPIIAGRPRNYTVFPRPSGGGGSFGGAIGGSTGSARGPVREATPPINWRPRSVARPASGRGTGITRNSHEGRAVTPPARRARGDGPSYPGPSARSGGGGRGGERARGGDNTPSQPRSADPPQRSQPSSGSGGRASGGGGRASGGGDHSAPSRPRRP